MPYLQRRKQAVARWLETLAGAGTPMILYVGFALALGALLALLAWTRLTLHRQIDAANWVAHTYEVSDALETVYRTVLEAESNQRIFTLTGKEAYLPPPAIGVTALSNGLARLRGLLQGDPTQTARLEELIEAVNRKVELVDQRIEERRRLGPAAIDPQLLRGQGPQLMERVRVIMGTMQAQENRLLGARRAAQDRQRKRSAAAQLALGLVSVGLLGTVFYGLLDQIARARRAETAARDATDKLQQANEELRAFSYSVAHDLRAPLRAVNGHAHILLEDHRAGLDADAQNALDRITHNGARMARLIDDLLALSRISAVEVRPRRIDMAAMAREVCDELLAAAAGPDAGRRVELQLTANLPPAAGDASLIRQVWVNLIGNALKFTRGQPVARIEIGGSAAGPEFVNYYVQDNGAGFSMSYLDKLFGPFQRLHREDEFEGTGIGLALVKRIIQRHGGAIWAEGREGEGALFAFTLPEWVEADRARKPEARSPGFEAVGTRLEA